MPFWTRDPVVDRETAEWLLACYEWLLRSFGGFDLFRETKLAPPMDAHFPAQGLSGHALASDLFDRVRAHAGMSDWRCDLVAQPPPPPDELQRGLLVHRTSHPPLGTFSWSRDTASVALAVFLELLGRDSRELGKLLDSNPSVFVGRAQRDLHHQRSRLAELRAIGRPPEA